MSFVADLRSIVGDAHVLVDPDLLSTYVRDWTGRFTGSTPAVVRPGTVDEVARVLHACDAAGIAVVPQGGNTGLVGGGVPLHGEVVVSLRRLAAIGAVESIAGQVTAQAGVTIAALQHRARDAGWEYGVDLGARESATVGGTIATNAGGLHVLRYGSTRRQVLGVEAVLADGRVLSGLAGLEKDNTGYDLAGLFCGSEGTLAVVTAARLRLVPRPTHTVVALLGFASVDDALRVAGSVRSRVESLSAVELFLADGLALVCGHLGLAPPFPASHAAYLLVEAAARHDPADELAAAIDGLDAVAGVAVASDPARRAALWRYREAHTEAINSLGAPHKLDVTLPGSTLAPFIAEVAAHVHGAVPERRDVGVWLFGHAADGNVHVNVTGVEPDDDRVTDAVLSLVAAYHGSISAEHGIGTAKRRWLHLSRSGTELAVMRAVKDALDPRHTLNPNVLLPPKGGSGSDDDDA